MSTRLPRVSSTLQEVGIISALVYFPFFGLEMVDIRVLVGRPSPRQTVLHLCEDKGFS